MTEQENSKNIVRKPRSTKNYINGVDFQNSLIKFGQQNHDEIPRYIGECVMQIAQRLAKRINFSSYSYREDMEAGAIEKMIEAVRLKKYDVNQSSNPLGYFTQIAWNSFLQRISKEKLQASIKDKNWERISAERDDLPAIPKSSRSDSYNNVELEHDTEIENVISNEIQEVKKKSQGYAVHSNLSYSKNRKKKENKINDLEDKN